MNRLLVGGLLTLILLALYLYALVIALGDAARCVPISPDKTCTLQPNVALVLETVGALIAAVVISQLSVTRPGEPLGARLVGTEIPTGQLQVSNVVAAAYVITWIAAGVALIVVGWFQHPDVPEVVSAGKEWLGFAIAAGYAYFGVSPPTLPKP